MCLFKQILEAAISVAFLVIHVITDINQAHRFTIFENIQTQGNISGLFKI